MKKLLVLILALLLVLGMTSMLMAGARKLELLQGDLVEGEKEAAGFAVINYTPVGEADGGAGTDAVMEIKVTGLLANTEYNITTSILNDWDNPIGEVLTFTTNKYGKATIHYNYRDEDEISKFVEIVIFYGENILNSRLVLFSPLLSE